MAARGIFRADGDGDAAPFAPAPDPFVVHALEAGSARGGHPCVARLLPWSAAAAGVGAFVASEFSSAQDALTVPLAACAVPGAPDLAALSRAACAAAAFPACANVPNDAAGAPFSLGYQQRDRLLLFTEGSCSSASPSRCSSRG